MRRAPARAVRACFVRNCGIVVVQEHDLRATQVQRNAKRTLSSHFTVHASHPALHTSHLHFTLHTSSHLKSCELFSPHLSSSHLIPSLLTCHLSKFFSTVFISSEHWSTFLISSKFVPTHLSCSARQKALNCQSEVSCTKGNKRRKLLHTEAWDTDAFTQKSLSKILCTTKLAQSTSYHYFVLQSLHKALPSTTSYYQACTKHVQYYFVLITKLAQSTSKYYFVLRSLLKALPSTTLYYKACTKYFPVLFVLRHLHRALRSTSLYYKTCTTYVPVLICTTKSLHKVLPSNTLYYKACTKNFPVLLDTTKHARSTFQYYIVLQSLHKARPVLLCTNYKACTKHFQVLLCTTNPQLPRLLN